ncbi:MAG: glucose-1-phosphate adenylyltransferase subunit GlgD [Ruminococcus sp.]|nr:glucose-1-phosphate adenylyltransferase subunit GlgD [Candidatus Copronaster equi]
MRANNVLGLIFANTYDECLNEITSVRSMGSVPYGGRYRLIDFQLSTMVNSGIGKVGIVTKSNYQSLMDHVRNGRAWDLSRKKGGLQILPPFNYTNVGIYDGRIEALAGAMDFVSRAEEEYVLMSDCHTIYNIDLSKMFNYHEEKNADITIGYINGYTPKIERMAELEIAQDGRITSIARVHSDKETDFSLNVILMRKSLLERLINSAFSLNYHSFTENILQKNVSSLKIYGYKFDGYVKVIDGLKTYFESNMDLLKKETRKTLLTSQPVYTKVKDDVPAIYGLDSNVKNSLVADGCVIQGKVENCILFRGVHIGKDSVIKNCVIMQNSYIGDSVKLNCVIADKDVVIKPNKILSGDVTYPVYIGKGIVI